MTDFRALCAELLDELQDYIDADLPVDGKALAKTELLVNRARAALAEQPVGPTDEELASIYYDCCGGCEFMDQGGFEDAARAVLARWGQS